MRRRAAAVAVLLLGACTWPACTLDFDIPGDVARECKTGADCTCADKEACSLECGSGVCAPVCKAGSTCAVDCGSGACSPTCEANAVCEVSCGSGVCAVQCDGKCKVDCGSGVCSCTGPGCP